MGRSGQTDGGVRARGIGWRVTLVTLGAHEGKKILTQVLGHVFGREKCGLVGRER